MDNEEIDENDLGTLRTQEEIIELIQKRKNRSHDDRKSLNKWRLGKKNIP